MVSQSFDPQREQTTVINKILVKGWLKFTDFEERGSSTVLNTCIIDGVESLFCEEGVFSFIGISKVNEQL